MDALNQLLLFSDPARIEFYQEEDCRERGPVDGCHSRASDGF